jgi:Zn-dependent M32 family carboxypeptidase
MSDHKLAAELVMRCFHSRTAAHVLHLKTKSYSEHKALNDFYDEIVDLVDEFAEMYQGEYLTQLDGYPDGYKNPPNAMALVNGLASWIDANRKKVCDSSQCQSQIDLIVMLCNQTAYKLKFLA